MGNRMSHEGDNEESMNDLDDGEIAQSPPQSRRTYPLRLRGGDASISVGGSAYHERRWINPSPPSRRTYHQDSHANIALAPLTGSFDFNNSAQPLPWYEAERDDEFQAHPFANCNDVELLNYMAARSISPGFLREIDQFLCAHPEIASCAEGRDMLRALSRLSPLEAYKYFLRGYTRPARYIDGIIKTEYFRPALDFTWCPLRKKYDSELVEFFDGFDYRHDIIDCIDREVHIGIQRLTFGRPVSVSLRKLISYSLWGNPVDAYKFFEYSYQQDFLPHRYVSEHVVLGHIPQSKYYSEPQPSDVGGWRRHGYVRSRMARARDQGVDVLDVLIAEYRMTLVRNGHRRMDIEKLCVKAKGRLDDERSYPTGVDVVNMIMDAVPPRTSRRIGPRQAHTRAHGGFTSGTSYFKSRGSRHGVTIQKTPAFLQVRGYELRQAKATLQRLYIQEENAANTRFARDFSNMRMIYSSRASAERRYVNCLIRYLRAANRMTAVQANQLQREFTCDKMAATGGSYQNYLIGMYPREL